MTRHYHQHCYHHRHRTIVLPIGGHRQHRPCRIILTIIMTTWCCHHTTTSRVVSPSPTLCVVPPRSRESNWEDDTKSSRTNADVTDYVPPWRDHQSTTTNKSGVSVGNKNSDTVLQNNMPFRTVFATKQKSDSVSSEGGSSSSSTTSSGTTTKTLLHSIKWPLIRDPPGVSSDYPLLPTRIIITVLSTIATWYLHVHNSHSPVLASSSCHRCHY